MNVAPPNLDLFRDTPPFLARAHREAAKYALLNPLEPYEDRVRRRDYHLAKAAELEAQDD